MESDIIIKDDVIIKDGIKYIILTSNVFNNDVIQVDDIFVEGIVTIPSTIIYTTKSINPINPYGFNNKKKYFDVIGFSNNFHENIKNKNITYFDINCVNGETYLQSIDGIIYNGKNTPIAIPPQLYITELHLSKETFSLQVNVFEYNPYLKRIYIENKVHLYSSNFDRKCNYTGEFIYNNKIIKKIDNKWRIIDVR